MRGSPVSIPAVRTVYRASAVREAGGAPPADHVPDHDHPAIGIFERVVEVATDLVHGAGGRYMAAPAQPSISGSLGGSSPR